MNIFKFLTPKNQTQYLLYNCTIRQALEKFDYYKFTTVPLIDEEGKFVTTLSEGDILRYIKNDSDFNILEAESQTIDKIEKYRSYQALKVDTPISVIIKLSLQQNFIPIVDDRGIFIGIIKRKSIIDYLFENTKLGDE